MERVLFSWLHLSDIHTGHGEAAYRIDQDVILSALLVDVMTCAGSLYPRPEAVLFTGDLGFSGGALGAHEYDLLEEWLKKLALELGIPHRSIFTIPGNHDVNREIERQSQDVKRLLESLRSGKEKLDTALQAATDRERLASRFNNYQLLQKSLDTGCYNASQHAANGLAWALVHESRAGSRIGLVGLNTALLSADDFDKGFLAVGMLQRRLIDEVSGAELVLILGHHPVADRWLCDQDEFRAWLANNADLYLSGHVHKADTIASEPGAGGRLVEIFAAACHSPSGERLSLPHGYNVGAIVEDTAGRFLVRIWPREWSMRRLRFKLDADNVPPERTYAQLQLAERRAPSNHKSASNHGLERELCQAFGLRNAVVVKTPPHPAQVPHALGEASARFLLDNVAQNSVLGLSCGRTIHALARSIPEADRPLIVVPISFNAGPNLEGPMSPYATLFEFCSRVRGAKGFDIPLPALLMNPEEELRVLLARPDLSRLLGLLTNPSAAFYSVGSLGPGSSFAWAEEYFRLLLPMFELPALERMGAVGEINWYPFDSAGQPVAHPIYKHCTALSLLRLQELSRLDDRLMVTVAGGTSKRKALRAALHGGFMNSLVTDYDSARELLSSDNVLPRISTTPAQ